MEAILSSDEVKGDPVGPTPITTSLQQIIMAISYLAKVNPIYFTTSAIFTMKCQYKCHADHNYVSLPENHSATAFLC